MNADQVQAIMEQPHMLDFAQTILDPVEDTNELLCRYSILVLALAQYSANLQLRRSDENTTLEQHLNSLTDVFEKTFEESFKIAAVALAGHLDKGSKPH